MGPVALADLLMLLGVLMRKALSVRDCAFNACHSVIRFEVQLLCRAELPCAMVTTGNEAMHRAFSVRLTGNVCIVGK
jgi:hypothetical protein